MDNSFFEKERNSVEKWINNIIMVIKKRPRTNNRNGRHRKEKMYSV